MSKKILITGASGFLGKHLLKHLNSRYEIIAPTKAELNLEDYNTLKTFLHQTSPDYVIHLAARCGGIGINQNLPADFFIYNNLISINILRACQECSIEKLITLGSVCSYPKYAPVPFKEEEIWNGYPEETNAPYGIAKKTLLVGCEAYNQQYGSNFIHLIPVNMYGEHDNFNLQSSHVIPALIRKFDEAKENNLGSVTVWGDGSASREFLYAGDCAIAIEAAMLRYNSPAPVNIGTGSEIKIKDLVTKVCDMVGFKGRIIYDNSKPNGQPRRCLDTSKAAEKFGFEATTSFDEGLEKTYNWYKTKYLQKIIEHEQ
jgi:GDP-L-fucose synthase